MKREDIKAIKLYTYIYIKYIDVKPTAFFKGIVVWYKGSEISTGMLIKCTRMSPMTPVVTALYNINMYTTDTGLFLVICNFNKAFNQGFKQLVSFLVSQTENKSVKKIKCV